MVPVYYYQVLVAGVSSVEGLGVGWGDEIVILAGNEEARDEGFSHVLQGVDVCDERSDEWKVISYVGKWYNGFAAASLHPSLLVQPHLPP